MLKSLDSDHSRQLSAWIEANQERIVEFALISLKQMTGNTYLNLPIDTQRWIALSNLPLGRFGCLTNQDYSQLVETSLRQGLTLHDILNFSYAFYEAITNLVRKDWSLSAVQRKFIGERIIYVGKLVASNLTTTYLKCVASRTPKPDASFAY